jgi:hypothetical protein
MSEHFLLATSVNRSTGGREEDRERERDREGRRETERDRDRDRDRERERQTERQRAFEPAAVRFPRKFELLTH